MFRRLLCCVLFLAGLAAAGCGGGNALHDVEGVVTVDSQPLEGATVTFTNGSVSASGLTTASGKFKLMTAGKEGAPAGTYKVTVSKSSASTGVAAQEIADPTEAYKKFKKDNHMTVDGKGKAKMDAPKSEIPERYKQSGNLPDQTVPARGAITIELKSK